MEKIFHEQDSTLTRREYMWELVGHRVVIHEFIDVNRHYSYTTEGWVDGVNGHMLRLINCVRHLHGGTQSVAVIWFNTAAITFQSISVTE